MPPKKKTAAAKAAAKRRAEKAEAAAAERAAEGEAAPSEAENAPDAAVAAAPEAVPDAAPEEAPEVAPEAAPEVASEAEAAPEPAQEPTPAPAPAAAPAPETAPVPVVDRMARFRELQARAKASSEQNTKAAAAETQRLSSDPTQLPALRRKHAIATHKLLKADVEDAGGDFERKRAWDWTAEESARWDKRMRKKEAHRDNNAFQDYTQEAHKVYKRQLRMNHLDQPGDGSGSSSSAAVDQYVRDKLAAVERAAAAGALELVETADGELLAIDKEGTFFSAAESTTFADNRPSKEAIDRLVNDQKKAEEAAQRKKRERMAKNGEDADVTFINEKNKHFNQKLARFYNKYTAEIRESFERGTMI